MAKMTASLALVVLTFTMACSQSSAPSTANAGNAPDSQSPAQTFDEISSAVREGKLRFEVRGLKNQATTGIAGGTSYKHTATVVALGDDRFTKARYTLAFTVKRVKGGDPDIQQGGIAIVLMNDGVGDLELSGGYRTTTETWEPEQIEIVPVGVQPWIPVKADPIREG